jgi:hypothetical protein
MHGFDNDGIRFAHADSWAGAGSTHIVDRREREAREQICRAPLQGEDKSTSFAPAV